MRGISVSDVIVLDDSSEDDAREPAVPPARRALIGAMDSSTHKESTGDEDEDDGFEILTPLPAPGRSLEDSMSFSELQAQQIAFAQLQRQAGRRKARAHGSHSASKKAPAAKGKAPAKRHPPPRGRSPSTESSPSSSPSPLISAGSSPRSGSKVLKKMALASPFDDAPPRSVSSSNATPSSLTNDKLRAARERRRPPSFSEQQAQEQVYSKLKSQWKKPIPSSDDSPASEGDSSDTEILDDDDDDFVSGPEKTADDSSDDDDFVSPDPKKPKLVKPSSSSARQTAAPRSHDRYAKKAAAKPKPKKRYAKKSLAKSTDNGKSAPAAALELITDTLKDPRDATSSVVHDATGALEESAKLLATFGQGKQLAAAAEDGLPEDVKTQEEVDREVGDAVKHELQVLKALYAEKTRAIIAEARKKTTKYLEELTEFKEYGFSISPKPLKVGSIEQELIAEMKQPVRLRPSQTVRMKFVMEGSEIEARKTTERPQDVYRLPKLRPLSKATTYVGVKANVRVQDDPIMQYVPYFGDQDDGEVIDVNNYEGIKARDGSQRSGLDGEVDEYLLRVIVRRFGDSDKVFSALKTTVGFGQGYSDYSELKKTLEARRLASCRISEAKQILGGVSKLATLTPLLQDASAGPLTLPERFAAPTTFFEANTARNFADRNHGLGLRSTSDYRELCVTYRDLFCRRCYTYDCQVHGIEPAVPAHRVDPMNPEVRLAPIVLAKAEQGNVAEETHSDEPPCIDVTDSPEKAAQEAQEAEDVRSEDTSAKDDEPMSAEEIKEVTEAFSTEERRRSSRSLTRISSRASASLKLQVARVETTKPVRAAKPKPAKKLVDESEYLDDWYYGMVSSTVKGSLEPDAYCSDGCWKRFAAPNSPDQGSTETSSVPTETASAVFTPQEQVIVDKLRLVIGDNACVIASMLQSTPCRDIYAFLAREKSSRPSRSESMDAAILSPVARSTSGRKRGRSARSQGSNNRELLKRTRYQRMKDVGTNNKEYQPCDHEGPCDSNDCSCVARDHTCDKACSCSRDCPNRFQGCRCSYGNCRTKACPCFVAMRECNPDLCVTCGASEAPVLELNDALKHKSAQELGICCNVNILRGIHKKIGVAFSTTHGWGAFAREPIKRGEFIYEYHGALLSQDEAERRGSIYDKMTISFLFDANEDSVVDAIRMGNKSKFANHASVGQKCQARVMRVAGEHRISIWAKQDIEKGEELFFDYGYHGESAPDWSQLRIKGASARHAKDDNSDDE